MADRQDELLVKEDWRYFAIDKIGTGLGSIATQEKIDEITVGFGLPSAPALFLDMAFAAHRVRISTDVNALFDDHPAPQGRYPDNHSPLFDYFQHATAEIIFSYSAIEATINELIPETYIYKRPNRNGQPPTDMSKHDIERKTSLDDKLKRVLPDALGKVSPASGVLWPPYQKLQDLRDRLIHVKSIDRQASGPEDETIWGRLLRLGPTVYPNIASDMISNFINERRWFKNRPTA